MQVVTTKYVKPTATKGPRMVAVTGQGKFYRAYEHAVGVCANHMLAAHAAIVKLERGFGGAWAGEWVASESVNGDVHWCNSTWATNRMVIGASGT